MRYPYKCGFLYHQTLSQAFVRFLEEESQPKPAARLPAVKMAEETEQKIKEKTSNSNILVSNATVPPAAIAFSFSPPLHPSMPPPPTPPHQQQLHDTRDPSSTTAGETLRQQQQPLTKLSDLLNQQQSSSDIKGVTDNSDKS